MDVNDVLHPDEVATTREQVRAALMGEANDIIIEKRFLSRDGQTVHTITSAVLVRDADGAPLHFVTQMLDISERKQLEERLAYAATHDGLTGLANRALVVDRLEHALTWARRHDDRVGVLYLDLDGFKLVNDTLGHAAGDALLVETARRLTESVRESDTVGRMGGDEFVVLIEQDASISSARALAERIAAAVDEPVVIGHATANVRASIGIAISRSPDESADSLLQAADSAMYLSKRFGRPIELDPSSRATTGRDEDHLLQATLA